MKIVFNPSTVAALTTPPNNKDITFDLRGRNIFARGVKFYGTDTNTWRDIKINNVSIGSYTLDLRNGSNTTLTNTNGVVTINSTWRPVVDNLTSDSTTSSLSAKQGKVLKALIDGKSNSDHNHDGRYVRYYTVTTLDCNNLAAGLTAARITATNAAPNTNHSAYLYITDVGTPFQIQIPDSSIPYIYKRYYRQGKWSEWFKLNAGYADSAGSVAWANVTGKPSSYTPSAHTHAWNSLTHSSTIENQAILTNGKANGWKLQTLNIAGWDNAANNAHSHANKSVLDGITSDLVNSWNIAYNFVSNITGTDTDKVINKWEEIVNFLAGITEDNKLNTLLNSKLSIQQLSAKDILTTKTNNALFWVDTKGNASTITTGPFTDHPYALLSVTNYNQNAENHKFFYRSRLAFSSAGDIKVASCHHEYEYQQDETWYNVLTSKNSGISDSTIKLNGTSITVYSSDTADGRYVRAFGTSNNNIDLDWGQSFKTFDPVPLGTPPEKNSNISLLSIGENFNRRKQLAFLWDNDNIYYRRHINNGFTNWRRLAFANEIPTSLKNPYALTISLNGTSQGPYDGSAAKNINITPGSIGAAISNHSHDYLVVNSADGGSFNSAYHNFQVLYAQGDNGITGKPANVDAFGLFKFRVAKGYSGQMLLANGGSLYIRSSEDAKMTNTLAWKTILDSTNYSDILDSRYYTESEVDSLLNAKLDIQNPTNYYWANVKISASSSTTTSPTVHTLTATRVCAGHDPGIDNSISCSNWFRSSGNTGWYNTTYQGGWYMSDTSWIRAHNGVGIYTSGQIYSSSSIRMKDILLEHTNEINNSANGDVHLNYRNSGNVSLCYGGGNVGIGTITPSYKLDVNGQMRASGFYHASVNSDNYMLLAGGGYKSFGGDDSTPIFLGYLNLYRGNDGTISSSFYCLGYSVSFTYTRGGNYCKIVIPDTTRLVFYIVAAIASVNYSGGGMDNRVGMQRGTGAWWLHCYAVGWNEVRVKGFCLADRDNDSWWGGNPLYPDDGGANKITVCIFGHVEYR